MKLPPHLMIDLEALDAKTDEELTAAAEADPDNPPLIDEQLSQFRRKFVKPSS